MAGIVGMFTVFTLCVAASTSPQRSADGGDPLLAEVRGLRADLQQYSRVSVRSQLLVARLELEEQRVNAVAGQLAELRRQIGANQLAQQPINDQLQRYQSLLSQNQNPTSDQQRQIEAAIPHIQAQLDQLQRTERQLKTQETQFSSELAAEQARWSDFNARLDELERQLPPAPK